MKSIRLRFLFLFILVVIPGINVASAQNDSDAARAFAESVWKMFDAGNYAQMYDETFDASITQTQPKSGWVQTAGTLAQQRGALVNRSLGMKTSSMGIYRFVFNSQCTGGKVYEDISITKRDAGWKVVAIFIRPNLE